MKHLLPALVILLSILPARSFAIIRAKINVPVLHSVFDGKAHSFYMPMDERPFLPPSTPPETRMQHRQRNIGRALSFAGGGAMLLGGAMWYNANNGASEGLLDDIFNGIMRAFGMVFVFAGAIVLIIGLMKISDLSESNTNN